MTTGDTYRALHARSLEDPEGFWGEQAQAIDWTRRWDKVLDASNPPFIAGSQAANSTPATTRSIVTWTVVAADEQRR